MRSRTLFIAGIFLASVAHGAVESTIDEWVSRTLPEKQPEITLPAYAGALDKAIAEVNAGKFRAALSTLSGITKDKGAEHALLQARALIGLGEQAAGDEILQSDILKNDPNALRFRIEDLLRRELPTEAQPIAEAWQKNNPDSIPANLMLAMVQEKLGDYPAAIKTYHWFADTKQRLVEKWNADPMQFESADDLCDIATGINRWATLTLTFKEMQDLNDTILNMYIRCFDVVDRQHIRSRVQAALFAASRGNAQGAQKYLTPAIQRAPYDPTVVLAALQLGGAIEEGDVAQSPIDALRKSNPDSYEADLFEAVSYASSHMWQQADERAEKVYQKYPHRSGAIGIYAITQYVLHGAASSEKIMQAADQQSIKISDTQFFAAGIFKAIDQYEPSEKYYQITLKRNPWNTAAWHQLGGMYLNIGEHEKARKTLEEAYLIDPYNVSTVNFIRLLDELDKFEKREFDHIIFYSDPVADPIAGDVIGKYMDDCYVDLEKIFSFTPQQKPIIQVYPRDDEFSVRMAGVPGIENYGVSFGRVLATISPRVGTNKGNFNWGRVLRHELVHTFNLMQTHHRTPRWLTEGLAVWQEGVKFRFKDVPPELYKRTMEGSLFTIKGFADAFVRPKRPGDGEQAYTQGAWLSMYLDQTYGRQSIVKLLDAYNQAQSDEAAFKTATGDSIEKIETDWHAWMKKEISPWNLNEETNQKVEALDTEGDLSIKAKMFPQAIKSYEEAYALQPTALKVHQRLAYLYLQKETADPAKAIEHMKFLHVFELQHNRFAKQIARMYLQLNDLASAYRWAHEAVQVDMYDVSSYELIISICEKMNNADEIAKTKEIIQRIKLWEIDRKNKREPAPKPPIPQPAE